jgi:hypothetical protein
MLPYSEKMMRSNGWSKVRPPVWYWLIVALMLVILYLFSSGAEGAQSPSQLDSDRLRVIRAIEGIEEAEGRQARALEGILKAFGKMKSCR